MPIPFDEHVVGRIATAEGDLVAVVVRLPGGDDQMIPAAAYTRLAAGESNLGYHQAVARAIAEAGPEFQQTVDVALAAANAEPPESAEPASRRTRRPAHKEEPHGD